jgi:TldD protein
MLDKNLAQDIISVMLENGADFAEIFVEDKKMSILSALNGKVESASFSNIYGIGIRGFYKTMGVYAYTNDFSRDNLLSVAKRVASALNSSEKFDKVLNLEKANIENRHIVVIPPDKISKDRKVDVMKLAYEGAFNYSDLITQVKVDYWDYIQNVLIINSEGTFKEDQRVRTRLMISAVATKDNEKETAFAGPGAAMGFEFFNTFDVKEEARKAAITADKMVRAEFAPAGKMPVIISNAFGGVIFHESCGHSLEATQVAKNASVFAGKLGQQIAATCVSAVDDPTIPNAWGSANIDDEGTPTKRNLLIENGILKSYMIDKLNARKMGMEPTGSARKQDYKFAPTSRMSNTFILPGNYLPEEIIAATEKGLYAKKMGGGSVNPSTGEFNFAVKEGYLIENGKITKPVRGATLIGKGQDILMKIDMVGNDLARGQGMCGSISGSIPADVGQPTIRVSELTVGGKK